MQSMHINLYKRMTSEVKEAILHRNAIQRYWVNKRGPVNASTGNRVIWHSVVQEVSAETEG